MVVRQAYVLHSQWNWVVWVWLVWGFGDWWLGWGFGLVGIYNVTIYTS